MKETKLDLPIDPPAYIEQIDDKGYDNPSYVTEEQTGKEHVNGNVVVPKGEVQKRRVVKLFPGLVMINKDVGTPDPVETPLLKRHKKKLDDLSKKFIKYNQLNLAILGDIFFRQI